jgi:hypothetical protein
MLKNMLFRKNVWLVTVLAFSSVSVAQQRKTQQDAMIEAGSHSEATATCDVTFSSGTGTNATKFCVTVNGNIAQFSVAGGEMIDVGGVGEGYGICDLTDSSEYYDYAYLDSGNFAGPTFTHSGNVVTVTRETNDSRWQLKQTITNVPATAVGPGSVKVSMALKNLTSQSRAAYLLRYADVDADGDETGNDFDFTAQTAFGLEPNLNRGLSSTNNTFNEDFGQDTFAQKANAGPHPCNPFVYYAPQPFHGDGAIVQFWSLPAGGHNSTHTVVSTYKPI